MKIKKKLKNLLKFTVLPIKKRFNIHLFNILIYTVLIITLKNEGLIA